MLVDALDVANLLALHPSVADRAFGLGHRQAVRHLVRVKGQAWYDAAAAATGDDDARMAEALLTYAYALPLLNLRVDAGGGIETTRWATLPDGTKVQTTYATVEAVAVLRADLVKQAGGLVDEGVVERDERRESGFVTGLQGNDLGFVAAVGG